MQAVVSAPSASAGYSKPSKQSVMTTKPVSVQAFRPSTRIHSAFRAQAPTAAPPSIFGPQVDYGFSGQGPTSKKRAAAVWENPNWNSIKYALADEPVDGLPLPAKSCDPMLGWKHAADPYASVHGEILSEFGTHVLSKQLLSQVQAETTPAGATSPAAMSLEFIFFVETLITFSLKEYMGPGPILDVLEALSFLRFGKNASAVLVKQFASLAAEVQETLRHCAGYEPSAVNVDSIIRSAEAVARAPAELRLKPTQGGVIFARLQQDSLSLKGEEVLTQAQSYRLVVAWGTVAKRYEGFQPSNQQVEFAVRRFSDLASLTFFQMEKLSGAMAAFKWLPLSTWKPLLKDICDHVVFRLVCGAASPSRAAAVLAVALHSADVLGPKPIAADLKAYVIGELRSNGLQVVEAELELASNCL